MIYMDRKKLMNGFARRAEKKKDNIKRAALELFKVHGFEKVSVNDIARKARVSKVTIYKHFGSKDELVNVVVKGIFLSISEELRAIIRGNMPFPEKLEFVIFRKTETASEYGRELIGIIDQEHPELKRFIHTLWQEEVNQLMLELFEEGRRLGYVDKDLSPEVIQTYFELLREGTFASTGLLKKQLQNAQNVRDLVYVILHGLMGKRG
jgi:AcrR family transcriptional regulator